MDKSEFVAYHLILPQAKYQLAKIKLKENDSKSDIVVDDAFLQHKMV